MIRTISGITAAFLMVAVPHAQDAKLQQAEQSKDVAPAHMTMILTGCLAAGDSETAFKLTKARQIEPTPQKGSVSEPASVGTAGKIAEFELTPETSLDSSSSPVDLKPFVGHQIQVTARPVAAVAPPAPKAGEASTSADPGKPADRANDRVIVTAVKQLAATCP